MRQFLHGSFRQFGSLAVALSLPALAVLGSGCQSVQVRSVAEPAADFSRFHTYNFAPATNAPGQPNLGDQNRQRIQAAMGVELEKRLLRPADQPDLVFSFHLATEAETYNKSQPTVESGSLAANLNKHYGLLYDKNSGGAPVVKYTEGTLTFQAVDTRQKCAVWESIATGVLYHNRTDEQVQQRIRDAVRSVFSNFPIKPTR